MKSPYENFYPVIAPLVMCSGVGDGKTTACVMAQAATIDALRRGLTLDEPTDEMECACPVLRHLAIRGNDTYWWKDDMERTEYLRPLIPLLLDSRGDEKLTLKRGFFVANNCVRVLTPMRLDWIAENTKDEKLKQHAIDGAYKLRGLAEIVDKGTATAAREVCKKLQANADASADASADAYASANADASADAYANAYADASADAYAYASANADASADAYANAYADASADANAQKLKYRAEFLKLFMATAAIK